MEDDNSVDVTITPSDTVVEETPADETGETPEAGSEPEVVPKAQYDTVHKRATRAEAELKALKGSTSPAKPAEATPPMQNVEETVLLAQGMPEELLTELKAVAAVRKVSLIKAQTDPIFVAVKEKFEKTKKREDASLPGSRGAGSAVAKKSFNTPGLSRAEHRKMVEALGK